MKIKWVKGEKFEIVLTTFYRALKDDHFDAHIDSVPPKCVFAPKKGNLGVKKKKRVKFEKVLRKCYIALKHGHFDAPIERVSPK